uniref:Transmembrane protein n=1 Tax=Heterorhabditis bacteriophora TaxID=37862 RepID=A0A1I7X6G4_HETBA
MNEYFNQYIEEYYEESEDTEEDEEDEIIVKKEEELREISFLYLYIWLIVVRCLDDIISLLERERVQDIVVISVGLNGPGIIDTMVICSPFNSRHGHAIAEILFVIIYYTIFYFLMLFVQITKRSVRNGFGWFQVEIGKVQVHVMTEECRRRFDIEGLWSGIDSTDIDGDIPLIPPPQS